MTLVEVLPRENVSLFVGSLHHSVVPEEETAKRQSAPAESSNAIQRTPDKPFGKNNDNNPTGSNSHDAPVSFVWLPLCWTLVVFVKLVMVNGPVPLRSWSVRTTIPAEKMGPGDNIQHGRLALITFF